MTRPASRCCPGPLHRKAARARAMGRARATRRGSGIRAVRCGNAGGTASRPTGWKPTIRPHVREGKPAQIHQRKRRLLKRERRRFETNRNRRQQRAILADGHRGEIQIWNLRFGTRYGLGGFFHFRPCLRFCPALFAAAMFRGQTRHRLAPLVLCFGAFLFLARQLVHVVLILRARHGVHFIHDPSQRRELKTQRLGHRNQIVLQPAIGRFVRAKRRFLFAKRLIRAGLGLGPKGGKGATIGREKFQPAIHHRTNGIAVMRRHRRIALAVAFQFPSQLVRTRQPTRPAATRVLEPGWLQTNPAKPFHLVKRHAKIKPATAGPPFFERAAGVAVSGPSFQSGFRHQVITLARVFGARRCCQRAQSDPVPPVTGRNGNWWRVAFVGYGRRQDWWMRPACDARIPKSRGPVRPAPAGPLSAAGEK